MHETHGTKNHNSKYQEYQCLSWKPCPNNVGLATRILFQRSNLRSDLPWAKSLVSSTFSHLSLLLRKENDSAAFKTVPKLEKLEQTPQGFPPLNIYVLNLIKHSTFSYTLFFQHNQISLGKIKHLNQPSSIATQIRCEHTQSYFKYTKSNKSHIYCCVHHTFINIKRSYRSLSANPKLRKPIFTYMTIKRT